MISVIKSLMAGDQTIVGQFGTTQEFWEKFFAVHRNDSVEALAKALGREQSAFEYRSAALRASSRIRHQSPNLAILHNKLWNNSLCTTSRGLRRSVGL